MKKTVFLAICLMLLAAMTGAMAAGMGIQMISGPEPETAEAASPDDIRPGAEIPMAADIFMPISFEWMDKVHYLGEFSYGDYKSGKDAEYACLRMDITNLRQSEIFYQEISSVLVVYDDAYEFEGWVYQYDLDRHDDTVMTDDDDVFPIGALYQGHYLFGCTLPNAVLESEAPLKMIITIGDTELTYHIRK